ncbi:hypothetical protein BDK51DRAFT_53221 [Blyttiomyces helicus]|uniref:Uncharacterized protein n=1 Tax=Blyttiomyces helicus TaxID=388810 RepID=A0A4P9WPK1_9FUNG|nr:hypothetical protein BDK51DRAFT_53221 [Blyttiomyces helicus]|eukprot:RKO94255.1 hypothetical protein BDK51DRAFT_53221 [Blyttiomyces helicus]
MHRIPGAPGRALPRENLTRQAPTLRNPHRNNSATEPAPGLVPVRDRRARGPSQKRVRGNIDQSGTDVRISYRPMSLEEGKLKLLFKTSQFLFDPVICEVSGSTIIPVTEFVSPDKTAHAQERGRVDEEAAAKMKKKRRVVRESPDANLKPDEVSVRDAFLREILDRKDFERRKEVRRFVALGEPLTELKDFTSAPPMKSLLNSDSIKLLFYPRLSPV